jgi:hypothetical protein
VCCTEFKRSNKETAASRANKAVFFVFGRCAQENASEGDYNNALEARRATHARKEFDMARCRRLGPKEMVGGQQRERYSELQLRVPIEEQRGKRSEFLQDIRGRR